MDSLDIDIKKYHQRQELLEEQFDECWAEALEYFGYATLDQYLEWVRAAMKERRTQKHKYPLKNMKDVTRLAVHQKAEHLFQNR